MVTPLQDQQSTTRAFTRRRFLVLAGAAPVVLSACGRNGGGGEPVEPGDSAVTARERRRAGSDASVRRASVTGAVQLDLAGRVVDT